MAVKPPALTGKKKQVGLMLKRMIERWISEGSGRNYTEVAQLIRTSQSRISNLVAGIGGIGLGDLKLLSERLGFADQEHLDRLLGLREDWDQRGEWWSNVNPDALHADVQMLVDMEWDARTVRQVGVEIVPGLLQCEPYIRGLFVNWNDKGGGVTLDDVVRARLERQGSLSRQDNPLQYHAVLSESCLRREVGGANVMVQQMEHLIELSKQENILLQVIPFKVLPTDGVIDRFELFELPSSEELGPIELACTEYAAALRFDDTQATLLGFNRTWARLAAVAESPDDTRKFLRHIARTYK